MWMNVMAFDVFQKFRTFARQIRAPKESADIRKLVFYFLYAQGVPLLIVVITTLIDKSGNESLILPNMGKYGCFLGSEGSSSNAPYFHTPIFLYYHLFLLIVQILNIFFFASTVKVLVGMHRVAKVLNR